MTATPSNPYQWLAIKITSFVLVFMALGVMGWKLYAILNQQEVPSKLNVWVWVGSALVLLHTIEGAIAAGIAHSRGESALKCGIYTFFTGMAGLSETYNQTENS